jgi:hypothetical protein
VSHRFLAALALVAAVTACTGKSDTSSSTTTMTTTQSQDTGGFSISMQLVPFPPKQGPATIVVGLKDARGAAVKSAAVTIVTSMPAMSMAGPKLTASDNGDGTYSAQTNLNYATVWTFDIRVKAGGKTGHVSVQSDVK